jgi:cytochrome c
MGFEGKKKFLACALLLAFGCGKSPSDDAMKKAAAMTGGDPVHGQEVIRTYGCGSCHTIPGVDGAQAKVGPSLQGIGARTYLAGKLPNEPANMIRWIRQPQEVSPGTAMPQLGVTEQDGKDIAAYLYTLQK